MSVTIYVQTEDAIRLAVRRTETHVSIDVQMLDERWTKSRWISDGDTVLVPIQRVRQLVDALNAFTNEGMNAHLP